MRVLVCGGRDYQDRRRVFQFLDQLHAQVQISLVIHGACRRKGSDELCGTDRWAQEWAQAREIAYLGVPAKWSTYGNSAGYRRNGEMLRRAKPERVVASQGGRGTADMIQQAENAGILVDRF